MKATAMAGVVFCSLLAGCGAEEDRAGDAGDDRDQTGVTCCVPSAEPSCDCYSVGGTRSAEGTCGGICDSGGPYELRTDANGCEYWVAAEEVACMIDAGDARTDSTPDDVALPDAPIDAPDPEICCPIDAWNCGCVYYGGTRPESGECFAICDADPPSASGTDENGCPFMTPGTGSCLDPGPDAGGCSQSTFACAATCGFNFSSFATDRDGLVTIGIAVGAAGPIQITSLAIVDSSPKASFSTSFVDYIDRISGGTWVANETDTAFEVSGDLAQMPAGSTFEIDVRFRSVEDGTGCPSAEDCGAVVVQWESCGVPGAELRLPIRR
jgi:hypothetical protein